MNHQFFKTRSFMYVRGIISIALLAYLVSVPDWGVLITLDFKSYLIMMVSVLLTLVALIFMSLRWCALLSSQENKNMSFVNAYRAYLKGLFFNIFMPGSIGGDLYRIKYCKDVCNVSIKKSTIVVTTERLFGAISLLTFLSFGLAIGGVNSFVNHININNALTLLAVVVLALIVFFILWKQLSINIRLAIKLYLLSLLAQGTHLFAAFLILSMLIPEAEYYLIMIALPASFFATVLPISIGGIGVRESVVVGILILFGIDAGLAVIVSILIYLSYVVAGILGMLFIHLTPEKIHK